MVGPRWQPVYCIFHHVEVTQHEVWFRSIWMATIEHFNFFPELLVLVCVANGHIWRVDIQDGNVITSPPWRPDQQRSTWHYFLYANVTFRNEVFI